MSFDIRLTGHSDFSDLKNDSQSEIQLKCTKELFCYIKLGDDSVTMIIVMLLIYHSCPSILIIPVWYGMLRFI